MSDATVTAAEYGYGYFRSFTPASPEFLRVLVLFITAY
jgi:hypothetical protein